MVDLLPGTDYQTAANALEAAERDVVNLLGRSLVGLEYLNEYRALAARQGRNLAAVLTRSSVDSLVLTPGYGRLLQLDPRAYGNGVAEVVVLELDGVLPAIKQARASLERQALEWRDWVRGLSGPAIHGVVLDTNVLLHHADRLDQVDWRSPLSVFPDESVTLAVPIVVVEELDRLKDVGSPMEVDGSNVPVKQRARLALAQLDLWFAGSHTTHVLHRPTADDPEFGVLMIRLLVDGLDHVPLETADSEIIDRALSLKPFAAGVVLATNDRSMRFRARHVGLAAFVPSLNT